MYKRVPVIVYFMCMGLSLFLACGGSSDSPAPAVTYSISGAVTYGGAAISAVTVTLSGAASTTTTTDASGNFSFSSLSNGSYTVTPSKTGYSFSPTNKSVSISSASATGNDFQALLNPAATTWAKTYEGGGGGGVGDAARSIRQTYDGGYVVAGYTTSFGFGNDELLIMRLAADGTVSWQKTYGGIQYDSAYEIMETSDGGYIVAGKTTSFGSGDHDFWLMKLSSSGTVTWQKTFGNSLGENDPSVVINSDGTFTIAGATASTGAGLQDIWVAKISASGSIVWQKTYGGAQAERNAHISLTSDGGYIIAADSTSFGGGSRDMWLLKLDSSGTITWQNSYGNGLDHIMSDVQQLSDGGYIVSSYDLGPGSVITRILKVNSAGTLVWAKAFGGSGYETRIYSIQETNDQGIIIGGSNFDGVNYSMWAAKLTSSGSVTWQKDYQGDTNQSKVIKAIRQVRDSGYIMAGYQGAGIGPTIAVSVMKTDANGDIASCGIDVAATSPVATPIITTTTTSISPATASLAAASTSVTPQDSSLTTTTVCSP
jgi:hypothetical protein